MSHHEISIPIAWGDMDALGHVNNALYFRYMESARVAFLIHVGIDRLANDAGPASRRQSEPGTPGVILQSVQARFRRSVEYPDTLRITSFVADIASDRFTLAHEMHSVKLGQIACLGSGVVVAYDYARKTKTDLPAAWRDALAAALRT